MKEPEKPQSNISVATDLFINEQGEICYWQTNTFEVHGSKFIMGIEKKMEDEG